MRLLKKFKNKGICKVTWHKSDCNSGLVTFNYPDTCYTDTLYDVSKKDAHSLAFQAGMELSYTKELVGKKVMHKPSKCIGEVVGQRYFCDDFNEGEVLDIKFPNGMITMIDMFIGENTEFFRGEMVYVE